MNVAMSCFGSGGVGGCPRTSTAQNSSSLGIWLTYPLSGNLSMPHLPVISLSRNQQNSGQPFHTIKLPQTYAASPSMHLSLFQQSKLGKTITLTFSGTHRLLHSNSIPLSPQCDHTYQSHSHCLPGLVSLFCHSHVTKPLYILSLPSFSCVS